MYLKRSTIDYHDNETKKSQKNILKRNLKKNRYKLHSLLNKKVIKQISNQNSEIEKKFIQIKAEITSNLDDLDETSKLLDEMIRATRNYNIIKKLFWSVKLNLIIVLFKIAFVMLFIRIRIVLKYACFI